MDKQIKKEKKAMDKGMDKLAHMDKKNDKMHEKKGMKKAMKKKGCQILSCRQLVHIKKTCTKNAKKSTYYRSFSGNATLGLTVVDGVCVSSTTSEAVPLV